MKRGDNLSTESFGLNSGIGFTRFHTPVHVGYIRYFRPTYTVCTTRAVILKLASVRPLPMHAIRTRPECDGRTVARPGIALRALTTARTAAQIER